MFDIYRGFKRNIKKPEGEQLITEKNEWGDYKVKGLLIRQLENDKEQEDLNKSVCIQNPLSPNPTSFNH